MQQIHHLIDGEDVTTTSGRSGPVSNPATGGQTGEVGFASVEEVDRAVASARAAFDEWRNVSIARRTKLLHEFRSLVVANADEIAARLTAEHGKVGDDARGEVARGIENIEFACGLADALKGTYSEQASTGVDVYTVRQPLGVCAGITPFNFPVMVPLWMFPNAVACGNTFILKPSERDPSAPRFVVELAQEAGFPPGVVNLVNGDKVAVDRLLEHPDVAAVSFVGSTTIARYVYSTGTTHGKRGQALGGCDCAGDDCGELYDSIRSCEAAHVDCIDDEPEPVSCEPMDVASEGLCAAILGYYWDGRGCRTLSGCDCAGRDCEELYDSIESCEAAHVDCGPDILPGDCELRQDGCLVVNARSGCYQIRARNGRLLNLDPGRNGRLLASLGDGWCGTFMLSLCRECEDACANNVLTGPVFTVCGVRGRDDVEPGPVEVPEPGVIGPVERPGEDAIGPVERPVRGG